MGPLAGGSKSWTPMERMAILAARFLLETDSHYRLAPRGPPVARFAARARSLPKAVFPGPAFALCARSGLANRR